MNIRGKFVTLRAIEQDDLELLRGMLNDPEMEQLVVGWSLPVSSYQEQQWYESSQLDQRNLRFVIETEEDGALGMATLVDIDWKNRTATHGMKLAKVRHRSKGVGTDTVMAVMRYAFDELQLHRLDGSWFASNAASRAMYMKCGWKEEGIRRSCVYKGGEYRDLTLVGILENEYREIVARNDYWA